MREQACCQYHADNEFDAVESRASIPCRFRPSSTRDNFFLKFELWREEEPSGRVQAEKLLNDFIDVRLYYRKRPHKAAHIPPRFTKLLVGYQEACCDCRAATREGIAEVQSLWWVARSSGNCTGPLTRPQITTPYCSPSPPSSDPHTPRCPAAGISPTSAPCPAPCR